MNDADSKNIEKDRIQNERIKFEAQAANKMADKNKLKVLQERRPRT